MTELSYEKVNKTITQQMTEYFDYDIDKAIEEQKENFHKAIVMIYTLEM